MSHPVIDFLRNSPKTYHPGWNQPEFTDWRDEQMSWKTTCYLGDWSFLWDARFTGPAALELFRDTGINSVNNFEIGQAKHLVQCNEQGKVIAEGILMRLGEDDFSTQSTTAFWSAYVAHRDGYDVTVTKPATFQFQVSGPTALATCQAVTGEDLTDIRFMRFREVDIAGHPVLALRQGMAGEIGFEFHGPAEHAEAVREAILAAGAEHGIRRLGRRTAMINHLEAAFPTGGWHYLADFFSDPDFIPWAMSEFDFLGLSGSLAGSFESDNLEDYLASPVELGWGRSIKLDHEFPGRSALEEEVANPRRVRVTLEWNSDDVVDLYRTLFEDGQTFPQLDIPHNQRWVAWFDAVRDQDGHDIGVSSTPGYSAWARKVLTLAYVSPRYAETGTEVQILWGEPGTPQRLIRARVAPAPYKPDNRRSDLSTPVTASATLPV
jgi:vanillate/3-O-methylgallate O-demethylase